MKNNILGIAFFLGLIVSFSVFAETVILKSGQSVEGKLIEKTNDHIKLNVQGVEATYYFDEIKSLNEDLSKTTVNAETINKVEVKEVKEKVEEHKGPDIYGFSQLEELKPWAIQNNKSFYLLMTLDSIQLDNYDLPSSDDGILINSDFTKDFNSLPNVLKSSIAGYGSLPIPTIYVVDPQMTKVIKVISVLVKPVEIPIGESYILGNKNAPNTMVMFMDFQCPGCASEYPGIKDFILSNSDKIRLVIKHYPLPFHHKAPNGAKAALVAGEQRKFFEMADLILQNQKELNEDKFLELAQEVGLDTVLFKSNFEDRSEEWDTKIKQDLQLAADLKVGGTPAFFLNGRQVGFDIASWKKMIDENSSNK